MQDTKSYTVWDSVLPVTITSSTDATPIVITATGHGFTTGDLVQIFGHATNIAANGIYKITVIDANTFSLQDLNSGANIAGSGAGAGSGGVVVKAPKILLVEDAKSIQFEIHTSGSASLTLKTASSFGKKTKDSVVDNDTPNFGATQAANNPWDFVQVVDLNTGTTINGTTGIVTASTDLNNAYECNVNSSKYITPILAAWTAGVISVRAKIFTFSA